MAAKHVYLCQGDSSTNDAETSLSRAISEEEVEEMSPEAASSTHTKR
ncbi:hypothetical protein PI125_g16120 [Phytophthora idaei]|nr:hypothetical protein PI125_g16120 [Phytophthora idaei]